MASLRRTGLHAPCYTADTAALPERGCVSWQCQSQSIADKVDCPRLAHFRLVGVPVRVGDRGVRAGPRSVFWLLYTVIYGGHVPVDHPSFRSLAGGPVVTVLAARQVSERLPPLWTITTTNPGSVHKLCNVEASCWRGRLDRKCKAGYDATARRRNQAVHIGEATSCPRAKEAVSGQGALVREYQ